MTNDEQSEGIPPGRKPSGMRFETFVERQIRMAIERGDFDNLPGAGKPLRHEAPREAGWWIKDYMEREGLSGEDTLPPALKLRRDREKLFERAAESASADAARALGTAFNRQVADYILHGASSGPNIPVHKVDPEELVAIWREANEKRAPIEPGPADDAPAPAAPSASAAPAGFWARVRRWFGR